jgi:hypothetical protein
MMLNDDEFRRVVSRYRDTPACSLYFAPALGKFLDKSLVDAIQDEFRGNGLKWERRNATPSLATQLPRDRGIYMFVWTPGPVFEFDSGSHHHHTAWILYIGKAGVEGGASDTFQDRYRQAYQRYVGGDPSVVWADDPPRSGREDQLRRYLTLRPLQYWYLPLSDVRYIPILEKRLVQLFRPPLNTQHGGIRARLGKPSPAW